ncbi:DNA methyltransferase [Enterococcus sp. AZ149]|uniref:site-specific DNA-methyltransferase n=1 Tax=Enterococcus TaxID=1350 RepID=UPI003F29C143
MFKEIMDENEKVKPNTAFLKDLEKKLPEFFSDYKYDSTGKIVREPMFDLEKFIKALRERNISELNDGYQIDFIGKDYAKKQTGESPESVITPTKKEQIITNQKNKENIFLTGDNLEGLRHLINNYENSIDMIYIDPPYNTGSDGFNYPDDFEYSGAQLKRMFGLNDEELQKLTSIQGKATHSAWLTFMYPRLWLAKRLLTSKGVIVISIDDNEEANLKLLLNEIFGEVNKLPGFVWQNKQGGGNDSTHIAEETESILVYAKNIFNVPKLFEPYDEEYEKRYKEKDDIGKFYWDTFKRKSGKQYYPITAPNGEVIENDENGNPISWLRSQERYLKDLEEGEIKFTKLNSGKWSIQFKQRIPSGKKPRSIITDKGTTSTGSAELLSLFGKDVFSNPKPSSLIKYLLEIFTTEDSTVLDFFAGSGTTADAVMQINQENELSNRKFILIQLDEPTYVSNSDGTIYPKPNIYSKNAFELGFMNIADLSKERIVRSYNKLRNLDNRDRNASRFIPFNAYHISRPKQSTITDIDSFDIDSGMFVSISGEMTQLSESGFDDMITPFSAEALGIEGDATGEDTIVTTWMVADGYKFDAQKEIVDFKGYSATYTDKTRLYLINEGWGSEQTKELVNLIGTNQMIVQTVVLYGYSFSLESMRELEIALKQLDSKVNLVKRY